MTKPQEKIIEIETISKKGHGQGALLENPSKKIEVAHTAIGDQVKIRLNKRKKKGLLLEVIKPSEDRIEPRCPHASICGGCTMQQIDYQKQLQIKESFVMQAFSTQLFSQNAQLYPLIPCEFPWEYRNKMEFTFSQNRAGEKFLGLMIAQSNAYVFHLSKCHLAPKWMAETVARVREYWQNSTIEAYHPLKNTGTLKTLTLRHAFATDEKMIILTVSGDPEYALNKSQLQAFIKSVCSDFENTENISIFLRIHQTCKGEPSQLFEMHLHGNAHIKEKLLINNDQEFSFLISPASFFQPNSKQAQILYSKVLKIAEPDSDDIVYDLYAGTGTLGIVFAPFVKRVLSIEINKYAVFDAKQNAEINNIENIAFHQGDVQEVLKKLKENKMPKPDIVLVDPPRAGLLKEAITQILSLDPKKIVYVSCNPITQAQDSETLLQHGYRLSIMQPIDQFAHTAHIENIALFVK